MMRSRKGDAFLLILDFLFLSAIILLFVTIATEFRKQNADEPLGIHQAAMLRTYASADQLLLSLDIIAKREALTAIRETAKAGVTIVTDTRCGTYAGVQRWNAPDGTTCFPAQKVYDALREKIQNRLRITATPNMPYTLSLTSEENMLRITGTGVRDVTIPILLTTEGDQRAADSLLSQNTVSTENAFTPDTRLGVTVRMIPGAAQRSTQRVSAIVIHATGTSTGADALAQYDAGSLGAHYLIDEDGYITQLAPENLRVSHLPACESPGACAIDQLEDTSIAIAIVTPEQTTPQAEKCVDGGAPRTAISWCGTQGYPTPANGCPSTSEPTCIVSASQTQRDALTKLVADIASRRNIPLRADTVFLEEQVSPTYPLATLALVPVNEDARTWWSRFIALVAVSAKTSSTQETTDPLASGAQQLDLPIEGNLAVSSCFGWRTVNAQSDFHDGIDFPGSGLSVHAAADGLVYAVCEDGKCDGIPARYAGFGNNIIIAHDGGVYTRYSHLSEIKVKRNDRVARAQEIGISGNTGRSTGAHLDFKVYVSENTIPEVGGVGDKAVEPLCFFSAESIHQLTLSTTSDSCKQYGGSTITFDNEQLRSTCSRFDVQPQPTCNIGTAPANVNPDDPTLKRTIDRLDEIPGLRAQITAAASENNVDELLVLALITQESKGDPNAISWTGCAGIGQFCKGTAELDAFKEIFDSGLRTCDCPGQGTSCTADAAGCVGDPRLDPLKSARAIPLHLSLDDKTFEKYTDHWRFAIASYNAGSPTIKIAIRATDKSDPTWEEVVPHIRDAAGSSTKTEEIVGYVQKVTSYWAALGGDTTPSQIGIMCTAAGPSAPLGTVVSVREVGSYTFTPQFSVVVPNGLSPVVGVSAAAQSILEACDGRDGTDPNACFTQQVQARFGNSVVSCVPKEETILHSFREFVADCRSSGQSSCGCAWSAPALPEGIDEAQLDLYGTDARLVIGDTTFGSPAGARTTHVAALATTAPSDAIVSIVFKRVDGQVKTSLVTWRLSSANQADSDGDDDHLQVDNVQEIQQVQLRPDGAWLIAKAPVCAPHKREHALCVDLGTSTRDENGVAIPLVARFALWLKDVEVPTAVSDVKAATPTTGGYMGITFTPSTSTDVSHYRIWCAPASVGVDESKPYTMTTTSQALVTFCNGEPIVPGPYTVRVVPFDIAGQRGDATESPTVDESDTGWVGVLNGLQDGFSEEDFFNAFVAYYTGG